MRFVRHLHGDAAVVAQLNASAHAFEAHDLAALGKTFVNDDSLTIFEGGKINKGWLDYRDNHIKPELVGIGTAILQKVHGQWLIVHWHSTKSAIQPKG